MVHCTAESQHYVRSYSSAGCHDVAHCKDQSEEQVLMLHLKGHRSNGMHPRAHTHSFLSITLSPSLSLSLSLSLSPSLSCSFSICVYDCMCVCMVSEACLLVACTTLQQHHFVLNRELVLGGQLRTFQYKSMNVLNAIVECTQCRRNHA